MMVFLEDAQNYIIHHKGAKKKANLEICLFFANTYLPLYKGKYVIFKLIYHHEKVLPYFDFKSSMVYN
jgi:hypothetical protein